MADLNAATSFDAEQLKEDITTGETKKPQVNVEADYELSQEFAVADIDKTDAGAAAATDATESKFKLGEPEALTAQPTESTGDPADFLEMAKDVNPLK